MIGTKKRNNTDRPFVYILLVFAITWVCAFLTSVLNHEVWGWAIWILDFFESASPLIVSLYLLRGSLLVNNHLGRFFFGVNKGGIHYLIVAFLFLLQFLNFYLFRVENVSKVLSTFAATFVGQIVLGGALEEGGWRGYLQPALEKRLPMVLSVLCVGLIWACWHLPYFLLPNNIHTGGNFPFYIFTAVVTSFILTAIHKLTGSVILCTLFHGWQNTIVMSIQADMGHPGFITVFILLGIISLFICLQIDKRDRLKQAKRQDRAPKLSNLRERSRLSDIGSDF